MKTIIKPQYPQLGAIAQMVADVFSDGKYVDQFRDNYIDNSHYDWDVSRIVLDGDKIIQHWGVWGYSMWVESVPLRVAGVGAVATLSDYRKQGWMHQAAQSSFDAMTAAGYDLSMLQGRHYVKMGYARAWNAVRYRVKLEDLPELDLRCPYRPLLPEQVGQMDAFYNRAYAHFTGAAIRPTFRSRRLDDICVYAWFDDQGNLAGYIRATPDENDPKTLVCLEAAGGSDQGLAVLRDLYRQGNGGQPFEKLAFLTIPYLHPMAQRLRKGSGSVEEWFSDVSGWRVRIVILGSALRKLVPLFEQRLARSRFASWQGRLLIDAGQQQAALQMDCGKVTVAAGESTVENTLSGGAAVARLLIGSEEPDEIIRQDGMTCTGLAAQLTQVLFPNLHPVISDWDAY